MKILVVDDESFSLNVAERFLREEAYDITTASDVDEAIDLIDKNNFDLVLTDILMPQKLGYELISHIKHSNHPIPVIAMTAGFSNATDDYILQAEMLADKAMVKPLYKDDLLCAVKTLTQQ